MALQNHFVLDSESFRNSLGELLCWLEHVTHFCLKFLHLLKKKRLLTGGLLSSTLLNGWRIQIQKVRQKQNLKLFPESKSNNVGPHHTSLKLEWLPWWSSGWRDFPFGPVVETLPSSVGSEGSIPGLGAKIPHASRPKNQNIKQKQSCNKSNKDFKNGPHQIKKSKLEHFTGSPRAAQSPMILLSS